MNPWEGRKAATLVSLHKQEAATAETDQLSSMQLMTVACIMAHTCLSS